MEKDMNTTNTTGSAKQSLFAGIPRPTVGFYIWLGIFLAAALFITYIVIRLVNVGSYRQPEFDFYEYDEKMSGKPLVLESSDLRFELDPVSTQFTLLQKATGKTWYSSPKDLDSDPIALAKEKNNMRSSLLLEYSTENGNAEVFDLYTNSVNRKFYSIEKQGDSIAVHYTIGQMNREYLFPLMMYQEDFEKWTANMSKSEVNTVNRAYHRYSLATATPGDDINELLRKYPRLEDEDLYLVFENIQNFMKEKVEALFKEAGFTYEDYLASKEQYMESNEKEVPAFNATVIYRLEGKNLVVEVPFDEISYRLKFPITKIALLPYFGAGNATDEGFIFIPEGGGSIINFNNGKTKLNNYYADVYGWDYAQDRKSVVTETKVAYPVFGIASGESSFISIIEDGSAYAGIKAEIAGKLGSYNYAYADYKMLHNERYDISARTVNAQYMFEKGLPEGQTLRQVYTFVDSTNPVDMAKAYREHLFKGQQKVAGGKVPVAVEIVGAIDRVQQVMGIPKNLPYTLTTYKQAQDIMASIDAEGIKDVHYKLSGFINGGIRQKLLNKVKFMGKLGGASDFASLAKAAEASGSTLYLDGTMQFAYHSGWTDGFFRYSSPARFVSQKLCELNEYSAIWYGKNDEADSYFLVRPVVAEAASGKLRAAAKNYGIGVSYRDFGSIVSADYNEKHSVNREDAMKMQVKEMELAKKDGLGVMINFGNAYALPPADFITNLDLTGNAYSLADYTVPFFQIALHGYKNFAGKAINLAPEQRQELLESAQSGAGLYFTFMNAPETAIQETNFTEYYSANFDAWKDEFIAVYRDYNTKIGKVAGALITDFKYETKDVTSTSFDNGYAVIVNFGYTDYHSDTGIYIPARDYAVVKVED
ncbi:MAG TPA: hypothetical protein DDW78_05660 [Treponema sp.]|nr:hypothetical protein [Treponema sp.]